MRATGGAAGVMVRVFAVDHRASRRTAEPVGTARQTGQHCETAPLRSGYRQRERTRRASTGRLARGAAKAENRAQMAAESCLQ
jgi:hypothetical protein